MIHDLHLPGTPVNASRLRLCGGPCASEKPPEGGVQINQKKWLCVSCWRVRNARKKK